MENFFNQFEGQLTNMSIPYVKRGSNELFFEMQIDTTNYFIWTHVNNANKHYDNDNISYLPNFNQKSDNLKSNLGISNPKENSLSLEIYLDIVPIKTNPNKHYMINIFCSLVAKYLSINSDRWLKLHYNHKTNVLTFCLNHNYSDPELETNEKIQENENDFSEILLSNLTLLHYYLLRFEPILNSDKLIASNYNLEKTIKNLVFSQTYSA